MTTSEHPPDADNEPTPAPSDTPPAESEASKEAADSPEGTADADLPEYEPLTPELVEEEALRADFMLRWAVVLLALMLGCTRVTETISLVRIRTGEYLAGHGWLPPRTDVFSYTALDHAWVNLGWLADLLLAGRALFALAAAADERQGYAVTGAEIADARADRLDHAGDLVPGHVRQRDVGVVPHPAVPVAAAHARRADAQHDAVRARRGIVDRAHLDGAAEGFVDGGPHCTSPTSVLYMM